MYVTPCETQYLLVLRMRPPSILFGLICIILDAGFSCVLLFAGTGSNAAFVEYIKNIEKWDTCYKDADPSDIVSTVGLVFKSLHCTLTSIC